jgi:hypothetical protein
MLGRDPNLRYLTPRPSQPKGWEFGFLPKLAGQVWFG